MAVEIRPSIKDLLPEGYTPRLDTYVNYTGKKEVVIYAAQEEKPDILIGHLKQLRSLEPDHLRRLVSSRFRNQVRYRR